MTSVTPAGASVSASPCSSVAAAGPRRRGCARATARARSARRRCRAARGTARGAPARRAPRPSPRTGPTRRRRRARPPRARAPRRWSGATRRARRRCATRSAGRRAPRGASDTSTKRPRVSTTASQSDAVGSFTSSGARCAIALRRAPGRGAPVAAVGPGEAVAHGAHASTWRTPRAPRRSSPRARRRLRSVSPSAVHSVGQREREREHRPRREERRHRPGEPRPHVPRAGHAHVAHAGDAPAAPRPAAPPAPAAPSSTTSTGSRRRAAGVDAGRARRATPVRSTIIAARCRDARELRVRRRAAASRSSGSDRAVPTLPSAAAIGPPHLGPRVALPRARAAPPPTASPRPCPRAIAALRRVFASRVAERRDAATSRRRSSLASRPSARSTRARSGGVQPRSARAAPRRRRAPSRTMARSACLDQRVVGQEVDQRVEVPRARREPGIAHGWSGGVRGKARRELARCARLDVKTPNVLRGDRPRRPRAPGDLRRRARRLGLR